MLSRRARISFAIVYAAGLLLFSGLCAEWIVRQNGWRPWQHEDPGVTVVPGGQLFTSDPVLGYRHLPGQFSVRLPDGYTFGVTHLPNSLRITRPLASYAVAENRKPELWIFGCSFTHGWSLNDEETFPWLLQERLPEREIVNFGVSGYGTVQSLLQFRAALVASTPEIAVLAYADFHDVRNTFLRTRRKEAAPWNRLGPLIQPYARLTPAGELQFDLAKVVYTEVPLMDRSALINFLETTYNDLEERYHDSHAVSEALVVDMARIAREHGVRFIVAGISRAPATSRMLDFARAQGIDAIDIAVDPSDVSYTNLPHDPHPNARANRHYADRLETVLR